MEQDLLQPIVALYMYNHVQPIVAFPFRLHLSRIRLALILYVSNKV